MLPYLQRLDLQLLEVAQQLLHLVLPTLELVLQLLVPELGSKRMPKLVGLQLAELLVAVQLVAQQLQQVEQLVVRQLERLVVQVQSRAQLVELQVEQQQVQNSSLVQILELGESRLLVH
jgi:hypothetical protein